MEQSTPFDILAYNVERFSIFLQRDVKPEHREAGLHELFKEALEIKRKDERAQLDFVSYDLKEPKLSPIECLQRKASYTARLILTIRLIVWERVGEDASISAVKEQDIFFGEFPLLTKHSTFIIEGREMLLAPRMRVPSGVYFSSNDKSATVHIVAAKGRDSFQVAGCAELQITRHSKLKYSLRFEAEPRVPTSVFFKENLQKELPDFPALPDIHYHLSPYLRQQYQVTAMLSTIESWLPNNLRLFPFWQLLLSLRSKQLEEHLQDRRCEIILAEEGPLLSLEKIPIHFKLWEDVLNEENKTIAKKGDALAPKALSKLKKAGRLGIKIPAERLHEFIAEEYVGPIEIYIDKGQPLHLQGVISAFHDGVTKLKTIYAIAPESISDEQLWFEARLKCMSILAREPDPWPQQLTQLFPGDDLYRRVIEPSLYLLEGLIYTKRAFLKKPALSGMVFCDTTEQLAHFVWLGLQQLKNTFSKRLESIQDLDATLPKDVVEGMTFSKNVLSQLQKNSEPFTTMSAVHNQLRSIKLERDQRIEAQDHGILIPITPEGVSLSTECSINGFGFIEAQRSPEETL